MSTSLLDQRNELSVKVITGKQEYQEKRPIIVVGGTAQDFIGEYMAGGMIVVLGLSLEDGEGHNARFVGTGMHGGRIYIRGKVNHHAKDVEVIDLENSDRKLLQSILSEFCGYFGFDISDILAHEFTKLVPFSHRPYGGLYSK